MEHLLFHDSIFCPYFFSNSLQVFPYESHLTLDPIYQKMRYALNVLDDHFQDYYDPDL